MRCYQHVGLTAEAEEYLEKNVVKIPVSYCPHCKEVLSTKMKVIASKEYDAFYGDGPSLDTYECIDGSTIKEVVQCMPWSSGPMGFLCLEKDGKKMLEWTEKEIEERM